jgi:hypothetical protein
MDPGTAEAHVLDVAEELFYSRGLQTVGMDGIRNQPGSLRTSRTLCGARRSPRLPPCKPESAH